MNPNDTSPTNPSDTSSASSPAPASDSTSSTPNSGTTPDLAAQPAPEPLGSVGTPSFGTPATPDPTTPAPGSMGAASEGLSAPANNSFGGFTPASPFPDTSSLGSTPAPVDFEQGGATLLSEAPLAPTSEQPIPTFTPPAAASPVPEVPSQPASTEPPAWFGDSSQSSAATIPAPVPGEPTDSAPTDLSQLTNSPVPTSITDSLGAPLSPVQPEMASATVTVPPAAQVVTSDGGRFPKWILFAGVGVIVIVAAASAYFILGIGKSTPAVPANQTTEVAPQPLIPVAAATPTSSAAPAGLGAIQGGTPSAVPTTQVSSPSGTSAIDLLKARQGQ